MTDGTPRRQRFTNVVVAAASSLSQLCDYARARRATQDGRHKAGGYRGVTMTNGVLIDTLRYKRGGRLGGRNRMPLSM